MAWVLLGIGTPSYSPVNKSASSPSVQRPPDVEASPSVRRLNLRARTVARPPRDRELSPEECRYLERPPQRLFREAGRGARSLVHFSEVSQTPPGRHRNSAGSTGGPAPAALITVSKEKPHFFNA
jgi:hypothetical protein